MKNFIGGLALAGLLAGAYGFWLVADSAHRGLFEAAQETDGGRTPGDADFNAIRLGYHGDPTDFRVEPKWYAQAAKQEARIARSMPRGAKTYARTANRPLALDANAFTLLGPQPLAGEGFGANRAAGRVNVVVSDPDDTTVAWLGADGGGIWKTTNCCSTNTSWTVKTDFPELASMAIDDMAMDPNNHDVLYAGTGDLNYGSFSFGSAGVLKSTDRGETWALLGTDVFTMMYPASAGGYPQYQAIGKVVVDPNNSNNVIAGTKTGLYFSNDAGVNWTGPCYTNAFSTQRQDMTGLAAVNAGGSTKIYAAVGTRGNRTPVQPDLDKNGANGVYSATLPASGCPTLGAWTLLNSGMPATLGNGAPSTTYGRIEIAVAPSDPQTVYAMISDIGSSGIYGIYKTTNGGSNWTKLTNPDGTQPDKGAKVGTQMWYDAGLTVSPTDPSVFFVSTVELLKGTTTSSSTATYVNLTGAYSGGPVHPDNHARAIVGGDANKVINGNDGGVYFISNATTATSYTNATWTDMNNGLPTIEVYGGDISANFATSSTPKVAAGFQDNSSGYYLFPGSPGTAAWRATNGGDGFYSRIEPVLGTRFYSSVYNGAIYAGTCTSNNSCGASSIAASGWSSDRLNFITTFDIYRYGDTSVVGSGCNTTAGCTHLIYGSQRLWETATATNPTSSSWKVQTGDLTKGTLVIGTDNRSYINQLHYAFTDPTIAIVGTTDGNVQYVFNLGTGTANAATAVNVTGGNAVLPNRTISDVSTDPVNPLVGYAAVAGFAANTPSTPGHVFQVTCTANCASFAWADKTGNLPDIPADAIIPNPNNPNQVFVGTDWGLYYTDDISVATPVWQRFEGLPHVMVWSLTIDRGFTTLAAFTRGRGVWAWPLPSGSIGSNHLAISQAPASIVQGNALGSVTVTEYDASNQQTSDSTTQVTLTVDSCGGTVLGTGTLNGGVITFATTTKFKTPATNLTLTASAAAVPPSVASVSFNVMADPDWMFWSGFEDCTP